MTSPGSFLDHIEYTEYARSVGNFVIREAIACLQEFAQNQLPYTLSVNLSPSHFLGHDFGTGYSSLDLFRRLQAREIKIDRSFVMDMLENNDNYMIVSAIVSLSQSFQRRLVAEGIESVAVEAKLIELGCELGQGFFYSRPMLLECLFCVSVMYLLTKAPPEVVCPIHLPFTKRTNCWPPCRTPPKSGFSPGSNWLK